MYFIWQILQILQSYLQNILIYITFDHMIYKLIKGSWSHTNDKVDTNQSIRLRWNGKVPFNDAYIQVSRQSFIPLINILSQYIQIVIQYK